MTPSVLPPRAWTPASPPKRQVPRLSPPPAPRALQGQSACATGEPKSTNPATRHRPPASGDTEGGMHASHQRTRSGTSTEPRPDARRARTRRPRAEPGSGHKDTSLERPASSMRERKSSQGPTGRARGKPLKSRHELHDELVAAQTDLGWLQDNVCSMCAAPVEGRQLYCSPACRERDLGSSTSPHLFGMPALDLFLPSTSAQRTSTSPSAASRRSNSTASGGETGRVSTERQAPEMCRDSISTHAESEGEMPPPTPSVQVGVRPTGSVPVNVRLPAPATLPTPAPMPISSSWGLRYSRRPSKASRPPPVLLESPLSPTTPSPFLHRRHRSWAMGLPPAGPKSFEPKKSKASTPPASRSYVPPMALPFLRARRRTSLTAAPTTAMSPPTAVALVQRAGRRPSS